MQEIPQENYIVLIEILACSFIESVHMIKETEWMVVERVGKYKKTFTAGINFIIPFFEYPQSVSLLKSGMTLESHSKS